MTDQAISSLRRRMMGDMTIRELAPCARPHLRGAGIQKPCAETEVCE
jgi:hypothetical protein